MQIKEVEKITGLTAKSIRYYESMGLLLVSRNEENDYRNYTQENIYQLKKIKLLRYLGFRVEEICDLLHTDPNMIKAALEQKADSLQNEAMDIEVKIQLCLSLSRDFKDDHKVVDEYHDTVGFIMSSEVDELKQDILNINCPSIWQVILQTLMFSGPILWLFYRIQNRQWDMLMITGILAMFSSMMLTLIWRNYFYKRKHQKHRVKKKNNKNWHMIPVVIATIIVVLAVFLGLSNLQQRLMAPKQWLFWEIDPKVELLFIVCIVLPIMWLFIWISLKIRRVSETSEIELPLGYSFSMKYKKWAAFIWILCLYCSFTSVNFVTEDTIIHYSPTRPLGITYSYEDVDKVKAEFGSKKFTALEYQRLGNFSYSIYIDDKKLVFTVPSVNQEIKRYEDSYLELEEFDASLMRLGVIKESDDTYRDACDLDKQYVERFLRIINHK